MVGNIKIYESYKLVILWVLLVVKMIEVPLRLCVSGVQV